LTDDPSLSLAADLNAWAENAWVIAPHGARGAARRGRDLLIPVSRTTTPKEMGAAGGNVLLVDGSVPWRNLKLMTNHWAANGGTYWNMW